MRKSELMKNLFTIILCIIITSTAQAQFGNWGGNSGPKIKGKITGQLIDSISNEKIGFATIALLKSGKTKEINGVLSGDDGKFKLADVKVGKYDLVVSFLGYKDKKITEIELTKKKPDYDLGKVLLVSEDYLLGAVEIKEKRSLIENKVDRIVFNAEDDASIAGGDATDVLRKVPTLSVDLDGNVSLRGSQNVRILINGKPSGMFSANVADALKMFPADQIKKVEVITSPGAKYDGEGSAGIINIETKKENIEGVAGSINASVGNRQSNANGTLNIGKGRFGFTANGAMYYSHPRDAGNCFVRSSDMAGDFSDCAGFASNFSDNVNYAFNGITNTSRIGFNTTGSAFYDFNAYNAINTSISYRGWGSDYDSDITGQYFIEEFSRDNTGNNLFSGYDWNTDYTKKFENNDKRELTVAVQVSGNIQNQENEVSELGPFSRQELINNDGDNLEVTAQIDYVHPIGKSNKLEIGAKTVVRNIDSDSQFSFYDDTSNSYTLNQDRSNLFLYDQDVYAGYVSYNFFFKKLNIVTGLRYERTEINGAGDLDVQQFSFAYDNFLPNIAISKTLKGFRTLKLSYSKRIQRPSLFFINPFRNTTDLANITQGNPMLEPELTNQFELGYNTNFLGITMFGSAYYKRTTEIIEQVILEDQGISQSTYNNVGKNNSIGVNLFLTKSIGLLTLRGGGDIYTYDATGTIDGREVSNSALSYRIFTSGEFSFTGSLKADFFGFFQAPRFTLQGEQASFSMYGVGFRKDFKNNMSLGIRLIEPFNENKSFDSDITGSDFRQVSSFVLPFRSFGVNFRYKFGKVDFKQRKSKIRNTDQKAGEGDGGGQGGGGQQGNNRGQ